MFKEHGDMVPPDLVKESGNTIYTAGAVQITTNPIIAGQREKRLPNVNSTNVCYIINFIPCWFYCCLVPGTSQVAVGCPV